MQWTYIILTELNRQFCNVLLLEHYMKMAALYVRSRVLKTNENLYSVAECYVAVGMPIVSVAGLLAWKPWVWRAWWHAWHESGGSVGMSAMSVAGTLLACMPWVWGTVGMPAMSGGYCWHAWLIGGPHSGHNMLQIIAVRSARLQRWPPLGVRTEYLISLQRTLNIVCRHISTRDVKSYALLIYELIGC